MEDKEFKAGDKVWCAGHINSFQFSCGVELATIVYISKKGRIVVEFDDDLQFDKVEEWPAVFQTKLEALEYDILNRIRIRERYLGDAYMVDTEIKKIQKEITDIKAV